MKNFLLTVLLMGFAVTLSAQEYGNHSQITSRAQALKEKYPDKVQLKSLAKTAGGKDIWVLTLGKGEAAKHPAIAIVGGTDGRHLLGVESAIAIAEKLLTQQDIDNILAENTYYIFPNVNPDATEQFFAPLKYERILNGKATDNDRDGAIGEDPYEDLNNDKMITKVRVLSPKGNYVESPLNPDVLVIADPAKGEIGKYLLIDEGFDNDKDGLFNEDGDGGVNFNQNFTFMYQYFKPDAGEWAVSEVETRAVADFLYDAFNVHSVVSFGLHNNISKVSKAFFPTTTGFGRENSADSKIYGYVSNLYNKHVPEIAGTSALPAEGGEFFTWVYQHYGRYSFATPAWWPTSQNKELSENLELIYMDWAKTNNISDTFVPWAPINHPDFPDGGAEVGGVKPYAIYNPPFSMVSKIADQHTGFISELTKAAPRLSIVELKKESLDKDISRVTLTVKNNGLMPTLNQIGERSYFLKYITIQLKPASGQSLIQGNMKVTLPTLDGGESAEFTWLIKGSGKLGIEAGTPTAGYKTSEITL